jgi:uncharacterized protein (TIGR02722 family)
MSKLKYLSLALPFILGACAPMQTTLIDPRADRSAIGMGLDSRDFDQAASKVVKDMLKSGALDKPQGGRYVVVMSRVSNDTMQRIDTDQLIKNIRVALLNSGKVVFTTAIANSARGAEDNMSMQVRQLRASQEFNQANVARQGQMVAPELSLSGKFLQNNNRLGDGSQRVDYSFQLTLTDLRTGLAFWEGNEPISKLGPGQTVAW